MGVKANITAELGVAVGKIAEKHRNAAITIAWRDGSPEQEWTVTADDNVTQPVRYTVNDETGDFYPEHERERPSDWPPCLQCGGGAEHAPNCSWLGCSELEGRTEGAVNVALGHFWDAVVQAFPETGSGDLDPGETDHFEEAARRAIHEWVRINVPPLKTYTLIGRDWWKRVEARDKNHARTFASAVAAVTVLEGDPIGVLTANA